MMERKETERELIERKVHSYREQVRVAADLTETLLVLDHMAMRWMTTPVSPTGVLVSIPAVVCHRLIGRSDWAPMIHDHQSFSGHSNSPLAMAPTWDRMRR